MEEKGHGWLNYPPKLPLKEACLLETKSLFWPSSLLEMIPKSEHLGFVHLSVTEFIFCLLRQLTIIKHMKNKPKQT